MLDCSTWAKERKEMHWKSEEAGEGRLRTVRQLMGSWKTTSAVLDFIAAMRAGRKAQKKDQEMARQERERNKACGLHADRLKGDNEEENTEREAEGIGRKEGRIE